MIRLGLTGGIGMGKSASTDCLRNLGFPVSDSDVIAREIVAPGQPALDEIRGAFGGGFLANDGSLDRSRLAALVFKDSSARQQLEAILHPRIRAVWQRALVEAARSGSFMGAAVIPLLYETHAEAEFDAVVCVACSASSQLARLQHRGWSDDEARCRIAAQWPVEEKMKRARFVIWTEPPARETVLQWRHVLATLGITPS